MHDNPKSLFVLARFFSPTVLKWSLRSLFYTLNNWTTVPFAHRSHALGPLDGFFSLLFSLCSLKTD